MAKNEPKEYPTDAQFPSNVNPTEANRKDYADKVEKEREEAEKELDDEDKPAKK